MTMPSSVHNLVVVLANLALAACATPEAPPVDGSSRVPINDAATISVLQAGFSITRAPAVPHAAATTVQAPVLSRVFRYHFPSGSTRIRIDASESADLILLARRADYIVVRGRTDADAPTEVDAKIARLRAESAKRFLVEKGGIPSNKITLDYLSAGDFIAENETPAGRAQNRRVEIEVYVVTYSRAVL